MKSLTFVLALLLCVAAPVSFAARDNSYVAIAYRLIPATKKKGPRYQWGTSGAYQDPREAAYYAMANCGFGCQYFVVKNACAGIAITKSRFGKPKKFGMVAAQRKFAWNYKKSRARQDVRKQLKRKAGLRVTVVRTIVACSD